MIFLEGCETLQNVNYLAAGNISKSRYFVIKVHSLKAFDNSITKETWNFAPNTERRINRALKVIIVIFGDFSFKNKPKFNFFFFACVRKAKKFSLFLAFRDRVIFKGSPN